MPSQVNNNKEALPDNDLALENTGRFLLGGTALLLVFIVTVGIIVGSIFTLIYFFPMIFFASWAGIQIFLFGGFLAFAFVGALSFVWYLFRKEPSHLESTNNNYNIGKSARK